MTMRCSFCRRSDSAVEKLVAGPRRILGGRVYICDRCATQTIQLMDGHPGDERPRHEEHFFFCRILNRLGWRRHDDGKSQSECHATSHAPAAPFSPV